MNQTQKLESSSRNRQAVLALSLAAASVLGVAGCDGIWAKDAYTGLQIMQAQVYEEGSCSVPAEPTSKYKSGGTLDLGLPDGLMRPYMLPLSIYNAMPSMGKTPAEEMNNITLQSFSVELSGDWYSMSGTASGIEWGEVCPQKFEYSVGTVRIPPAGYVGTRIEALQSGHAYCLSQLSQFYIADVTATVIARGRHGGTSIQSAPFKFRIRACKGCLQSNLAEEVVVQLNGRLPLCSILTTVTSTGGCYPGQDDPILCCSMKATNMTTSDILCPAVPMGSLTPSK